MVIRAKNNDYFTDNLFCHYADIEDKLENLCFQHLARKYGTENIYLGRDDKGKEIDFIVKTNDDGDMHGYQVCYMLTEENFQREVSSLLLFQKHMNEKNTKLFIISMFHHQNMALPGHIQQKNIIDLLLE